MLLDHSIRIPVLKFDMVQRLMLMFDISFDVIPIPDVFPVRVFPVPKIWQSSVMRFLPNIGPSDPWQARLDRMLAFRTRTVLQFAIW